MFLSRLKGTRGENIDLSQYRSIECFLDEYVFSCQLVSVIPEGKRDSSCVFSFSLMYISVNFSSAGFSFVNHRIRIATSFKGLAHFLGFVAEIRVVTTDTKMKYTSRGSEHEIKHIN